jgi:hypothetical protein
MEKEELFENIRQEFYESDENAREKLMDNLTDLAEQDKDYYPLIRELKAYVEEENLDYVDDSDFTGVTNEDR